MNKSESIFQDANYYFKSGQAAGKENRHSVEIKTKVQAIAQARLEFNRRKLVTHETAFIEGYVSSIRGGYFTENDHVEAV